ncbi:MAG: DNA-binding MarR family transcriptional regulator [Gammaproteobacteria bacterium]|jgi:DNA-binding MarR family transcriptional regulator
MVFDEKAGGRHSRGIADQSYDFPLQDSIGALIRFTHRGFADDLQAHLHQHLVNVGMWYFLRALWEQNGLTQRELSRAIGVSEPTTVQQLRKMEAEGLIERRRSSNDRRKTHIHLTKKARALRRKLIPYAREVNDAALQNISSAEIGRLCATLEKIRSNLRRREVARVAVTAAVGTPRSRSPKAG